MEDGNFRLNTRFLEHGPVTSPPANQKKVTHPAALTRNFAYKNFSLRTIGEFGVFEHEPPILLAWPYNKLFSAPNSNVSICLAFTVHRAHELVFSNTLGLHMLVDGHLRITPETSRPHISGQASPQLSIPRPYFPTSRRSQKCPTSPGCSANCWAALGRPINHVLAQLQHQRKSLESVTETPMI